MTDSTFDAARACGECPPKGWGWKDADQQRKALLAHFDKGGALIDPWMIREATRLGLNPPDEESR